MSEDNFITVLSMIVSSSVSIIGLILTSISMKQSFKNELERNRDTVALEKMSKMPFEVLTLLDNELEAIVNDTKTKTCLEDVTKMLHTIYCYGSEDSIRIVALMQKEIYDTNRQELALDMYRKIAFFVLLATQIKKDVTTVVVTPELWYQMRIMGYYKEKSKIKYANNRLVEELKLDNKFII